MAFNGAASVSQGVDPTSFSIEDVSTGSDAGITGRRVYLYLSDGSTLTPSGSSTTYIDWPIVSGIGDVLTLTGILNRDYSLNVQVQWISSSPLPSPSTYLFSVLTTFTANLRLFLYTLTQLQAGNPLLIEDNDWFENKSKVNQLVEDADNATLYNDQYNAQLALNAAYKYYQNGNTYF